MSKTTKRIKAAASAVALCLLAMGTAIAGETPAPHVTFTIKNANGVFTNEASFGAVAYPACTTPITVMRVTLSEAYKDAHKIYLAASTNGNWACVEPDTWKTDPNRTYDIDKGDLIGMSTSNGGTAYADKIRYVEFQSGETEKDVYIYGLKGDANSEKYGLSFYPYPQYSSDFYKYGKHQGVILYLSPSPVEIAPQPVTGATAKVYTNDTVEIIGKGNPPVYSVRSNAQVSVVYTATNGFMFAGGYRTLTTNLTASASETTVTLAQDRWPVAAKACTNCITFAAEANFGIRMVKGRGTTQKPTPIVNLEYSTDQVYWKTFDPDTDYAAGADHKLCLRGQNNATFASAASCSFTHVFANTADSVATAIACSGNIETLLDYTVVAAGQHPTMGDFAFCYLFNGCTSLTAAPELPATNLAKYCYASMFDGCTSLTAAPELPATTLANNCYLSMFNGCTSLTAATELPATTLAQSCYASMFYGCTSLTAAPELPATTLAQNCYNFMFKGCTSLIVNTNAPGKAWSIPEAAAASASSTIAWNANMFAGTPGDITNAAVTCGTPYYVASVPVPIAFSVTAPTGAEAKVYTNAVDAANLVTGDTVWSYRDAFVVYTVTEEGTFFENGQTAVTNRLDTKVVTATDQSAYVPAKVGTPSVQLGVVAQRYPWNGLVDIQYKTPYYGANRVVTFKANGTTIGTAPGTGGQVATAPIDLNTTAEGAFKGKALKGVKVSATIE